MRVRVRITVILSLLLLTAGLAVHYDATYENEWPYPTGDQLAEDPDGWDGERVLLFGTVTSVDAEHNRLVMEIEDGAGEVARVVEVRETSASVSPGGVIQVYGVLSNRGTVQSADAVVVVNEDPSDQRYKLGTSVLGVGLAAGLFLWYWGFDWRRLEFEHRDRGDHG